MDLMICYCTPEHYNKCTTNILRYFLSVSFNFYLLLCMRTFIIKY